MYEPKDLLDAAIDRFGLTELESRVAPGADSVTKDTELMKIATSVYTRVRAAAQASVGWPLPGQWPAGSVDYDGTTPLDGTLFADRWPDDLIQHSIELFDWRTYAGMEQPPAEKRKLADAAEKYFIAVQNGDIALGLLGPTDAQAPTAFTARDRQGHNLLDDGASDRPNLLDTFRSGGWDF